jgi:hypothetical protein
MTEMSAGRRADFVPHRPFQDLVAGSIAALGILVIGTRGAGLLPGADGIEAAVLRCSAPEAAWDY